jgi:hypothetical protein
MNHRTFCLPLALALCIVAGACASENDDAADSDGSWEPAVCSGMFVGPAAIRPAQPIDHVGIYRGAQRLIALGQPCAGARDQAACAERMRQVTAGDTCSTSQPCTAFALVTQGERAERHDTPSSPHG